MRLSPQSGPVTGPKRTYAAGVQNESGVGKIRNFQPRSRCIGVTVQDRTKVTIND